MRKGARKQVRARKRSARMISGRSSAIRETEEARALLENHLGSLYWWVFNACKMKGFIRAKALSEAAERPLNAGDAHSDSPEQSPAVPRKARNLLKK
jgi:hypothetical protein